MKKSHIFIVILVAISLNTTTIFGQTYRQEKRIYLVDVTASMVGKGKVKTPNIFDKVKYQLITTIQNLHTEDTEIVIIPFTDKPHNPISGNTHDKQTLIDNIKGMDIRHGDTNIADAWLAGIEQIDSSKINYIFLLTDGLHNCGPDNDILYSRLTDWANISANKYYFAFYVMLTENAGEMKIANIVEQTAKIWLIKSMNVNVSFISTNLHLSANINHNNSIKIGFSSNDSAIFKDISFHLEMTENPYYKIIHQEFDILHNEMKFELEELIPRIDIPIKKDLQLFIRYDKNKYPLVFFTPEEISFTVLNKGVRTMKIKEL